MLASLRSRRARSQRPDTAKIDRLLELTQQRLILAHDVARYKWNRKAAISDPKRENELLDGVVEQASAKHLDPVLTRSFFEAQIEASKMVQQADFDDWKTRGLGPFTEVIDLKDLRVKIDALNSQLIDALLEATPFLREASGLAVILKRADEILKGEGINNQVRSVAIKPLLL